MRVKLIRRALCLLHWLWRVLLLAVPGGVADPVSPCPERGGSVRPWLYALGIALASSLLFAGPSIHLARALGVGLSFSDLAHVGWPRLWTVALGPLGVCLLVSAAVVGLSALLSSRGWPRRPLRRGLSAVLLVALLSLIIRQDFAQSQLVELGIGLLLALLFFHHLIELCFGHDGLPGTAKAALGAVGASLGEPRRRWRIFPWLALVAAFIASTQAVSGLDRTLAIGTAIWLAAVLFTAPWSVAASATTRQHESLRTPRAALAATGLVCIAVLIFREEPGLLATSVAGAVLVALCTRAAWRTGNAFTPFAVALGLSVFAFAGIAALLENLRSPKVSPIALVTKDGALVCGAYIGATDNQLTYARLTPVARPKLFHPGASTEGSQTLSLERIAESIRDDRLLPVSRAMRRAAQLGGELADSRRADVGAATRGCRRPPSRAEGLDLPMHRLAKRFQPTFALARDEMFSPVSVNTVFSLEGRDGSVCLDTAMKDEPCDRLTSAEDLPWSGHRDDTISLPERLNRTDMRARVHEVLGDGPLQATATVYFIGSGPGKGFGTTSIQYWTYYVYNYVVQAVPGLPDLETGAHLSDFEYVGIVLSARGMPRYVFMSRHGPEEGRSFHWHDERLMRLTRRGQGPDEDHIQIAVARGSHANYEQCGDQPRDAKGLLRHLGFNRAFDDHADCRGERIDVRTPLVDLARTPWTCWPGRYGRDRLGLLEKVLAGAFAEGAPRAPLQQQKFDKDNKRTPKEVHPCSGVRDPRDTRSDTEETLPSKTANLLSNRAGRIERWVDDCSDWSKPPLEGALLVACDQDALDTYFKSGLDRMPSNPVRVIDPASPATKPSVPAVARDRRSFRALERWRIQGADSVVTVYAARRMGRRLKAARFTHVRIGRGQHVRVSISGDQWQLVDGADKVLCSTKARRLPRPSKCAEAAP